MSQVISQDNKVLNAKDLLRHFKNSTNTGVRNSMIFKTDGTGIFDKNKKTRMSKLNQSMVLGGNQDQDSNRGSVISLNSNRSKSKLKLKNLSQTAKSILR